MTPEFCTKWMESHVEQFNAWIRPNIRNDDNEDIDVCKIAWFGLFLIQKRFPQFTKCTVFYAAGDLWLDWNNFGLRLGAAVFIVGHLQDCAHSKCFDIRDQDFLDKMEGFLKT